MPGLIVDEAASREYSAERGAEYTVLRFYVKNNRITEDEQIAEIGEELYNHVDKLGTKICLDFKGVEFVSASFMGKLITAGKRLKQKNLENLALRNVEPPIYEVFVITRLNRFFDIDRREYSRT